MEIVAKMSQISPGTKLKKCWTIPLLPKSKLPCVLSKLHGIKGYNYEVISEFAVFSPDWSFCDWCAPLDLNKSHIAILK